MRRCDDDEAALRERGREEQRRTGDGAGPVREQQQRKRADARERRVVEPAEDARSVSRRGRVPDEGVKQTLAAPTVVDGREKVKRRMQTSRSSRGTKNAARNATSAMKRQLDARHGDATHASAPKQENESSPAGSDAGSRCWHQTNRGGPLPGAKTLPVTVPSAGVNEIAQGSAPMSLLTRTCLPSGVV